MGYSDDLLFLNTPVSDESDDIIGVGTHIKKLNAAIDSDAQMIAITSPFGAGKTSVIELLQASREKKRKDRTFCEKIKLPRQAKEKVVKISMWSHLPQKEHEKDATNLHRTFIYQLASRIKPQRGSYVYRRLNPNYGMLRLYTNKMHFWVLTIATLFFALVSWIIKAFSDRLEPIMPEIILSHTDIFATGAFFLAIFFGLLILTKADILFSFKKGEDGRDIDTDEIIDLYRTEFLKPRRRERNGPPKLFPGTHYIVVIEDLDRTENHKAVISFLTELRKYCAPNTQYKNRVTFVVNIKPESVLNTESSFTSNESLYAKIFDFVLNLQTINIDNYDAILEGLLQSRKEKISSLGLKYDPDRMVDTLPGMQWIIREQRIGIREIKERLNIAFSLYEALHNKFSKSNISMATCAAVAYLTTAFEKDFYSLNGREFGLLVDKYIEDPSADYHICNAYLNGTSEDFQKTVWQLISVKLIDASYRSYFYNYPKDSKLYNTDESHVLNAILYGEQIPDLNKAVERVLASESTTAITDAFHKIDQLKIQLPDLIFETEFLYIEALRSFHSGLIRKLKTLDYSADGLEKTLQLYLKVLSYDKERHCYSQDSAAAFCEIWEEEFSETALLQWRKLLCRHFPNEILWYRSLFFGVHGLITKEESDALALASAIAVTNCESKDFSAANAQYVQERFAREDDKAAVFCHAKDFLVSALEKLDVENLAEILLDFMLSAGKIVPEFEKTIFPIINDSNNTSTEELFEKYQALISQIAVGEKLSKQTLGYISKLDRFDGYSEAVATQLFGEGYILDYVLLSTAHSYAISFEDEHVEESIKEELGYIQDHHPKLFAELRLRVSGTVGVSLERYSFLFEAGCPILRQNELDAIQARNVDSDALIMMLVPQTLVEMEHVEMLAKYFCRQSQDNKTTFAILDYISGFAPDAAKACFCALDFDKIRYRYISAERRSKIKTAFSDVLELDTPEGKIAFMECTKFLDSQWEPELVDAMNDNQELHDRYIALVNQSGNIKNSTVQTICKLSVSPMAPAVNEKLFEAKKYAIYVSSKAAWDKHFTMETGERGAILWPVYLQMFQDSGWKRTRGYMVKNSEFIARVMHEKAYLNMDEEAMMQMCGVLQDQECLQAVLNNYGADFALKYYLKIAGFQDRPSAETFLELVKKTPVLLESEALYEHTHDMLVDGILKAKYTRMRKKAEY